MGEEVSRVRLGRGGALRLGGAGLTHAQVEGLVTAAWMEWKVELFNKEKELKWGFRGRVRRLT